MQKPISQIPPCIRQISLNAPFCDRNVHVCKHFYDKMTEHVTGALWDLWFRSITISQWYNPVREVKTDRYWTTLHEDLFTWQLFPHYWNLCVEIFRSHRPVIWRLSLSLARPNSWTNNIGNWRRHAIVMTIMRGRDGMPCNGAFR